MRASKNNNEINLTVALIFLNAIFFGAMIGVTFVLKIIVPIMILTGVLTTVNFFAAVKKYISIKQMKERTFLLLLLIEAVSLSLPHFLLCLFLTEIRSFVVLALGLFCFFPSFKIIEMLPNDLQKLFWIGERAGIPLKTPDKIFEISINSKNFLARCLYSNEICEEMFKNYSAFEIEKTNVELQKGIYLDADKIHRVFVFTKSNNEVEGKIIVMKSNDRKTCEVFIFGGL